MVHPDALGRTGAEFTMDIERGKIREFARATGSDDTAYLQAERPVVPPTFLVTQSLWQTAAANPWTLAGLDTTRGLHAEQEFVFFGPPPVAGTRLSFQTRIAERYSKPRKRGGSMEFVVAVTSFHDAQGRLVAEARATAVELPPAAGDAA